jgi:hypothetical protein
LFKQVLVLGIGFGLNNFVVPLHAVLNGVLFHRFGQLQVEVTFN